MSDNKFGAFYYKTDEPTVHEAGADHSYYFKTYIGKHEIEVEFGDCVYFLNESLSEAVLKRGPCQVNSEHCATVIKGFMPANRTCEIAGVTLLPYVNGCSTKQLFSPPRLGDPTLQYLKIPKSSAEQAHHIHSTVRVVYVLGGKGKSVVGMENEVVCNDLVPGSVCILDPMCPHHFETPYGEELIVIPLHVFSSVPGLETNHPMFNGTHLM